MGAREKPPATDPGGTSKKQDVAQDQSRPVPRLNASPVITHSEVVSRVEQGGCLRGVLLEAQEDDAFPKYAVFVLSSWRKEYTVLGFNSAERPRLFRDLDRVLRLVRIDYRFKGTVALRLASDAPPRQHSWRITHGANLARPAARPRQPTSKNPDDQDTKTEVDDALPSRCD